TMGTHSAPNDTPVRTAGRDGELVARARAKDRSAEELLYRTHVESVTGLAMRLLGRSSDAEDVVQDAFVTAFTRMDQLRDGALFRAWLMRITVHEVHRRYRRRKLLRTLGLDRGQDDVSLAGLAAPHVEADQRAELAVLDRVLARLPARQRVVWMLRNVEGQELAEIASACEASLASIKRWLVLADQRIAAHVAGEVSHD
ncbi:MAG TPA: RNA polymerase sigma factor, partial [Polyangiales bacterium]|nr:RNA polymerase sigma factor [Polyangiales bacterium]